MTHDRRPELDEPSGDSPGTLEPLLTAGDAAKVCQCVPATIIQAANAGRLPVATRTAGGVRLFRREDVERFKADREPG